MPSYFKVDASHIELGNGDGLFNSDFRYIRAVADSGDKTINICRGGSIEAVRHYGGGGLTYFGWRWRVGSATETGSNGPTPPDGFNTGIDGAV